MSQAQAQTPPSTTPPSTTPPDAPQPDAPPARETDAAAAVAAATWMQRLDPGPLAELRRMDAGTGAPAFWRLLAWHPDTLGRRLETWMEIIRILALLMPKGDPEGRPWLHKRGRRLGTVLCDGGDPQWSGPEPAFSERRLAQLLATRGPQRIIAVQRAARMLAPRLTAGSGIDTADIALAVLDPDNARRLAEPYYRRLDRAAQSAVDADSKKGAA